MLLLSGVVVGVIDCEGGHDAFGTIDHRGGGTAGRQNGELVAAETRDATNRRHDAGETLRNLAQYVISHTVTQRVVHILEPIEIHHEDGNRLGGCGAAGNSSGAEVRFDSFQQSGTAGAAAQCE